MFDDHSTKRRGRSIILAGVTALSLAGLMACADTAQAFPAAPAVAGTAVNTDRLTTVQYTSPGSAVGHRGYAGRAGLYTCGLKGTRTHLARQACGGNNKAQRYAR